MIFSKSKSRSASVLIFFTRTSYIGTDVLIGAHFFRNFYLNFWKIFVKIGCESKSRNVSVWGSGTYVLYMVLHKTTNRLFDWSTYKFFNNFHLEC